MADSLHGGPSAPQAGMEADGAGGCACFLGCPFRQEPSKTGANLWGVNVFQITCVLQPNRLSAQFETMWRLRPLTLFPGRCKRGLGRAQSLLCNGGCVGRPFTQDVKDILSEHCGSADCQDKQAYVFNAMPERRAVESSFARLEKIRRLCKELRAAAPYLLAVHSYRIFGSAVQDTKRLWGTLAIFSKAFLSSA
nr:hypothetical protein [uncultured Ottowia sp.]